MGIRGEIFTLGTLLYVDSLYVGFRTWKSCGTVMSFNQIFLFAFVELL